MAGEPVFTAQACYHGSPEDTQRKLQSGVIRGVINEGTPDARVVRFDLRGTTGAFERERETTQASTTRRPALGAPLESIGRRWDADNDTPAFPISHRTARSSAPRAVFEMFLEWADVGQNNAALKVSHLRYAALFFFNAWSLKLRRIGGEDVGPPTYSISIPLTTTDDMDDEFTVVLSYSIYVERVESLDDVIDKHAIGDDENGKEITAGLGTADDTEFVVEILRLLVAVSNDVAIGETSQISWNLDLRIAGSRIKPVPTRRRAIANVSSSSSSSGNMPIGLLLWWWWWGPWWWWWWATPVENIRLAGEDGSETAVFNGTIRVGVRERETGATSSAGLIGCADGGGGDADRYSLGLIEIATSDSSVPLRVTSAVVEPRRPPVRAIAHISGRPRQVPGVLWASVAPEPGAAASMEVTVERENANATPWAGQGFASKYALKVGPPGPARQGLRLWLMAGEAYIFEAHRVPKKHPFHITQDGTGGTSAPKDARLTTAIHSKTQSTLFSYTPQPSRRLLRQGAYYQCTIHDKMGGPITIYQPGVIPMLVDEISGSVVLHNKRTGKTVVVGTDGGDDDTETEFDTVGAALNHLGLELNTPAAFRVGEDISPDSPDMCCATLKKREGGNDLDDDEHTPAVLVSKHGDHHCNHIHALAEIRTWLQERKPDGSSQLCPHCT